MTKREEIILSICLVAIALVVVAVTRQPGELQRDASNIMMHISGLLSVVQSRYFSRWFMISMIILFFGWSLDSITSSVLIPFLHRVRERARYESEGRKNEENQSSHSRSKENADQDKGAGDTHHPDTATWWEILQVDRSASWQTIRAHYRKKAKAAHPDSGGNHETACKVNEAYAQARKERGMK